MKVVIIDDSSFMRRLIRAALLDVHPEAQVEEFADAAQALAALPTIRPDLITLDMLMPGMHGLTFLTELRQTAATYRVIIISADVQKSVRQKCQELGASDFIEKPITFEKLQAVLEKFVTA